MQQIIDIISGIYEAIYESLDNRKFINNRNIYHYTTIDSLYNILGSNTLHLTHGAFLNDYKEIEYGLASLKASLKNIKELMPEIEEDELDLAENLINTIEMLIRMKSKTEIFIGAFSCLEDSLSQWRAYSLNATGVGIGLNTKKVDSYCSENELLFGSVIYGNDFKKEFQKVVPKILPILKKTMHNEEAFSSLAVFYFLSAVSFMKHPGFKEESEVRVVSFSEKGKKNKLRNGLYLPYKEINFSENIGNFIDEIWIGPAANQELVERSVELLIEEKKIEKAIIVKKSKIPYRVVANG